MKKIVKLICNVPCQISINGEKGILRQSIDVVTNTNFYASFLPLNKKYYLPASIKTNSATTCVDVQIVPFNTHTEILYSPSEQPDNFNQQIILNKKYNNCIFSIASGYKGFLNIDTTNYSHKSTLPPLTNASLKTNKEYTVITAKTNENLTYVVLFNTKSKKVVFESCFDSVENTKNSIKCVKFPPSIAGYGTVYQFDYSTCSFSKYNIYKASEPHICKTEKLVPYAFLESIKYGDYSLSKHYLDNNLVSNEHLKAYFGDIQNIYFNGLSQIPNYTIYNGEYKNYTFSMQSGKIMDIEENNINNN